VNDEYVFDSSDNEQTEPQDTVRGPIGEFLEHQRKALEETGRALDALLPPGFKEHSAEARKEFASGFKVLLDAAIDEIERVRAQVERKAEEAEDKVSSTGTTKVKVQVSE
jgi:hypothetical protein